MSSKIPEHLKEWVDHNFDRLANKEKMVKILKEEFNYLDNDIRECILEAQISHNRYANFIETIKADFNDIAQLNINLENLKAFLTIERENSSPEIITNRIRTQLISLDKSCLDFGIRAKKIAFFNALDILIIRNKYDFPYPDPVKFEFFPIRDNLCDSCDEDLKNFENHKFTNAKLCPLAKVSDDILYLIKNDSNIEVVGSGSYGKICKGLYQNKLVAIKHINVNEYEYEVRWKCIIVYYRQSLVALEQDFDGVVPMQEIFFYQEKSIFDDCGNCAIVAIYPLCKNNFLYIVREDSVLNDYQDFKPLKNILETMIKLHQNNICINDLSPSNVLFDYSGNIFFNDFDFWLPKNISDTRSLYVSEVSISDVCCGLSEISFIESEDLSLILPDKSDIWCFGAIILDGFGYFNRVTELSWKKTNMQKYVKMDRSSAIFKEKLNELKICAENMVNFVKEDMDKRVNNEFDESKKNFLKDVKEVLLACLQLNPKDRCSAEGLINYNLFLMVE
ncbi:MAG: hypothetical protein KGQ36_02885 [Rickettsiales bacterium]|nr:hypothetical protein [Rickettsiales bacterium]